MAINQPSIPVYDFIPNAPPSVVGEIGDPAGPVTIRVWENGVELALSASGCTRIGNTPNFVWSTVSLPGMSGLRQQCHYQMTDGVATAEGDFIMQMAGAGPTLPPKDPMSDYLAVV